MSKVAVVPSPRVPVSSWMPMIASGLKHGRVHSLEEVKVLGDNVPAAQSWVGNPARQNSGLIFRLVTTNWESPQSIRERNEALLGDGTDYVLILGYVQTSSAKHALSRAFATPGLHVIQVIDNAAQVVGAKTVQVAPGYEITEPKKANPREDSVWGDFMKPAPPAKK